MDAQPIRLCDMEWTQSSVGDELQTRSDDCFGYCDASLAFGSQQVEQPSPRSLQEPEEQPATLLSSAATLPDPGTDRSSVTSSPRRRSSVTSSLENLPRRVSRVLAEGAKNGVGQQSPRAATQSGLQTPRRISLLEEHPATPADSAPRQTQDLTPAKIGPETDCSRGRPYRAHGYGRRAIDRHLGDPAAKGCLRAVAEELRDGSVARDRLQELRFGFALRELRRRRDATRC